MPRDISGNYTLPVGNPVVSGTIIDVAWANPTMSDVAAQLNNVITRDGVLAATSPIKFTNGTAGAPAITFNSDLAMGFYRVTTNVLGVSTAGTERMRIDALGTVYTYRGLRVGEGTTAVNGGVRVLSTDGDTFRVTSLSAGNGIYLESLNPAESAGRPLRIGRNETSATIRFNHNSTNIFADRTTGITFSRTNVGGIEIRHEPNNSHWGIWNNSGTICYFYSDNGTTGILAGSISVNGNVASYNSVSDVRLKKNIVDADYATNTLSRIQVRQFEWKGDGKSVSHGFIAQELDPVFPDAVTQGDTWSVDSTKLVPLLTKSLQEAWAAIEDLRAQLAESKTTKVTP